jgi:hypothetical protein
MKPKILVIKRADMEFDIRSQRIATSLRKDFDVKLVGVSPWSESTIKQESIPDFNIMQLSLPERAFRKIRREILQRNIGDKSLEYRFSKDKWIHSASQFMAKNSFDLIIACDIDAIAASKISKSRALVIGDMHEHAPTELANQPGWLERIGVYKSWLCEEYLPTVDVLYTVSSSLAKSFSQEFRLELPEVLRNVAPYTQRIKKPSNMAPNNFIHHGIAAKIRRLEEHAILANRLGDPYQFNMMLQPVEYDYYGYLKGISKIVDNFKIIAPVAPSEIIQSIAKYDAGIYLLRPETEQLRVTLPNKFFEFVQARLPIFSGGLGEMDALVERYRIGVCIGTPYGSDAAEKIRSLQNVDWLEIHSNLDEAAYEMSLEKEFGLLVSKVKDLLSVK